MTDAPITYLYTEYTELKLAAKMYDVCQKSRIAKAGMLRSAGIDSTFLGPIMDMEEDVEKRYARALKVAFRTSVPREIIEWQKASGGVGEHLLARLLGVIGSPYVAFPRYWREGKPGEEHKRVLYAGDPFIRRVSDLWSYCGHGDPSRKMHRGMTQREAMGLGSPEAKMLVHLLAESCMKQQRKNDEGEPVSTSPYRDVYDAGRYKYAFCVTCQDDPGRIQVAEALGIEPDVWATLVTDVDRPSCPTCGGSGERLHIEECLRCGPSGKPALVGSKWSLKHQHMAALRLVGKALLKDLWIADRAAYQRENPGEVTIPDEAAYEREIAAGEQGEVYQDSPGDSPF